MVWRTCCDYYTYRWIDWGFKENFKNLGILGLAYHVVNILLLDLVAVVFYGDQTKPQPESPKTTTRNPVNAAPAIRLSMTWRLVSASFWYRCRRPIGGHEENWCTPPWSFYSSWCCFNYFNYPCKLTSVGMSLYARAVSAAFITKHRLYLHLWFAWYHVSPDIRWSTDESMSNPSTDGINNKSQFKIMQSAYKVRLSFPSSWFSSSEILATHLLEIYETGAGCRHAMQASLPAPTAYTYCRILWNILSYTFEIEIHGMQSQNSPDDIAGVIIITVIFYHDINRYPSISLCRLLLKM